MTKTVEYVVQQVGRIEGVWVDWTNPVATIETAQDILRMARDEGFTVRLIRRTIVEEVLE